MLNGALPPFEIGGGLALALGRGLFDAALFSLFGTVLFWTLVLPRALGKMPVEVRAALEFRLLALARASMVAAVATGAGWLVMEAGSMAGADAGARSLAAVPTVVLSTAFGHLLVMQMAGLGLAAASLGRRPHPGQRKLALLFTAGSLLLQAGHGHAMSMYGGPSLLLVSDAVHLLAGGAWLGGLLPLLLATTMAPPRAGATAARSFSLLGKWCVALMGITATVQGWVLVGSIPALLGSAYGWTACLKLLILVVLLGFAWVNRYRLAPALLGDGGDRAKRRLATSIAVQTCFGLLVLLAAGVLANLPPGMHEQAVWPFSLQPSLVTIEEDAGFRREVLLALLVLAGAIVLAGSALFLARWRRIAALLVSGTIGVLAVPHLDLLFIAATPTSFFHSPTGFAAASIADGAALFPVRCASCHGATGAGDGPLAATLPVPPADLTAGHLWMHTDGEMFWWLTHGIEAPTGGLAMPGFGAVLSPDQRWALIDFIRAHNAGLARKAAGRWPMPVQAPSFQAICAGNRPVSLADERGRIVRVVIGTASPVPDPDVVTVLVTSDPSARSGSGTCIADDQTIRRAYAIVSGIDETSLPGRQFLIDTRGWLRNVGEPVSNTEGAPELSLENLIRDIRQHPLAGSSGADHMNMPM